MIPAVFPAFCLGNGPSLTDLNLDPLEQLFTVGVNRAFKNNSRGRFPFDPTVLIYQDKGMRVEAVGLAKCASMQIHYKKIGIPGITPRYRYDIQGTTCEFSANPLMMSGRGSTGPHAIQFAYSLGANPIVLLGYDCALLHKRTDFYGRNRNWTSQTLRLCIKALTLISEHQPEELTIINCSLNEVWPRQELTEVIENLKPEIKTRSEWEQVVHEQIEKGPRCSRNLKTLI